MVNMEAIKEWYPVISGVCILIFYTLTMVTWIVKGNAKREKENADRDARISSLEKDHDEHRQSVKHNADELWRKFDSFQNKLDQIHQGVQSHLMSLQNSIGKIEGELTAGRKRR